jgi:hypothetical protein
MRSYFAINTISEEEKSNILSQHKTLYNGYQTLNPEIPNTQPLYVQDFAKDKVGAVMGNNGNIKGYTNMGINEGLFDNLFKKKHKKIDKIKHGGHEIDIWSDDDEIVYGHPRKEGDNDPYTEDRLVYNDLDALKRSIDSINKKERGEKIGSEDWQSGLEAGDMSGTPVPSFFPKGKKIKNPDFKGFGVAEEIEEQSFPYDKSIVSEGECSECGGAMMEGECSECGWTGSMEEDECSECGSPMEEETGHLDDIYDEEDLNPSSHFDYVEGGGNAYGTFEKAHHMKEQSMKTPIGKISAIGKMEEQGGNAIDMDVDDVESAYDFVSDGPMTGDPYPVNEDGDDESFDELINMDLDIEDERDNLEQEGYEQMESAWADDIDEVDVSGSQGIYGDMDPAYDFDSEGPGKGGPYQEYHGETISGSEEDEDEFDPTDKSWKEITAHTGGDEFGYVDEDIRESFISQKNRIREMMNRMKIIK